MSLDAMYKEWLLDISHIDEMPCFVPYENGNIIFGMNVITDRCPAKLVGVISPAGQKAVEKWCEENPDWYERYKQQEVSDGTR